MQEHDRTYIFVIDVDSDHVARMQGQDRPILALILVMTKSHSGEDHLTENLH
jgi:hypothetical protein